MSMRTTPVFPRIGTVAGGASTVGRARRVLQQVDFDKNFILLILGILTFAPLVVMVFMSGKDQSQWFHERFGLSLPWHWENYTLAWAQIVPPLDAGLKLIDWWLNAAFDESIMSRQKATFSRSATCGHPSWTIPAWIAASVSRRPALHQRSIAAIGGTHWSEPRASVTAAAIRRAASDSPVRSTAV